MAPGLDLCENCHHFSENHAAVCNGSIECLCEKYISPVILEFAQAIEKYKASNKAIYDRVKFVLEKIPSSRNASEKQIGDIYREIWYGFKIRATGTSITTKERNRMPGDDSINRQKRFVKADNPQLRTYDSKVQWEQSALYLAIKEMAVGI